MSKGKVALYLYHNSLISVKILASLL